MTLLQPRHMIIAVLTMLLLVLQWRLWFGEGSLRHVTHLNHQVKTLEDLNQQAEDRNRLLAADVRDLKQGTEVVEEIARKELGMIRKDEVFFQFIERRNSGQ